MQDQNKNTDTERNSSPNKMANKGHGPQGVDKAPGEEAATDIDPVVYDTQKGKNKVDGDPEKESDQPTDVKE